MKNKADYSKYECPYSHLDKECGHELHGPEGYKDVYGVWCACGFRAPLFYLDPDELGLKLKKESKINEEDYIMSVDISKLKREHVFENEKIKISFSIGTVCNSLSVYIKDEYGENHHILWKLSPDRNQQGFDKVNEKIRVFVQDKIDEWVSEEEEAERLREESIQKRKTREENELRKLMDSF